MQTETKERTIVLEKNQDARVTTKVLFELKQQIVSGAIAPGGRFPPERELAKKFRVNRAAIRETLNVMESIGVLSRKVGDGTYLNSDAEKLLRQPLEFLLLLDNLCQQDLTDTRLIVEPELTARAAERATGEDLAAMNSAIVAMEKSKNMCERIAADLDFHRLIFRASGNRIFYLLFSDIHRLSFQGLRQPAKTPAIEPSLRFHRCIYTAIKRRNSGEARDAMRAHLLDVQI